MLGWTYRGTKTPIRRGDKVLISKRLARDNKVNQSAIVVDLRGFITVELSDNTRMDVDARQCVPDQEENHGPNR